MGHLPSTVKVPEWSDVHRHATHIRDIALLSYYDLNKSILELNGIIERFAKKSGKRLIFAIKTGSDNTLLWKATIKIVCLLVDVATKKIESHSLLTLNQYLHIYQMIMVQVEAKNSCSTTPPFPQSTPDKGEDDVGDSHEGAATTTTDQKSSLMSDSVLFDQVVKASMNESEALDECCICLERKPEVILPCAHSYCVPCIAQWNVTNMTCPICREEIKNTDDSWVISEAPDSVEIEAEVQRLLNVLVERTKTS